MDIERWTQEVDSLWQVGATETSRLVEDLTFRLTRCLAEGDALQRRQLGARLDRQLQRYRRVEDSYQSGLVRGALQVWLSLLNSFDSLASHKARVEKTLAEELLSGLELGPTAPSQLAEQLGRDRSQVSRALKSLAVEGLVEQMQIRPGGDGRQRLYRLVQVVAPAQSREPVPTGDESESVLEHFLVGSGAR